MFSNRILRKAFFLLPVIMMVSQPLMAQPKPPSTMSNPLAQALVIIMVLLAVCIAILANVVNSAAAHYREKIRDEREKNSTAGMAMVTILFLLALPFGALAQDAVPAATAPVSINGLTPFVFYLLISVIAIEILILIALVYQLRFLVGIEARVEAKEALAVAMKEESAKPKTSWWWRLNKSHDLANEEDIDLSHDYDGISELDNKLPPWWTVAFGITILFSVVYMYRYHVAHSAPLQIEELEIAIRKGEADKAAYLAKSAANVDENSVTMLDAAGIENGKTIFAANCTPCHGSVGEGNAVGPNLTDTYWLHGGSLNDIFRTIKYGVAEKGMRSWQEDLSPMQISELTSYIKSLAGSNPPNAKEPQGEPYDEKAPAKEEGAAADSTGTAGI